MMDRAPRVADRKDAPRLPRHRQTVEFDRVGFSYHGRRRRSSTASA